MEKKYILVVDHETINARAVIFDDSASIIATSEKTLSRFTPKPGWVEQDAEEIWSAQVGMIVETILKAGLEASDIAAIGIANQRETIVVWDKNSGKPIYHAIAWESRQSEEICAQLQDAATAASIRQKTGLVLDPYFSASKIKWILDNVPHARQKAINGELLCGTIDTWLIWNLTGGKEHVTDYSNASRTLLFNIHTLAWDEDLLHLFDIPHQMLPSVRSSSEIYGYTNFSALANAKIPIAGAAGDQQAALFGQACLSSGMAKNTYGTGCFVLMNIGEKPYNSDHGLLTTIAWGINNKITYALEGSVFSAGSAVQWLRDQMKLIDSAMDSEYFASKAPDSDGVYMVPAFSGLGAPHWNSKARGAIFGLTRGSTNTHLIRATLDSIAYQTKDILDAMQKDTKIPLQTVRVDGAAARNNVLMQFQADILNVPVDRPQNMEIPAVGAAYLAGLSTGIWTLSDLQQKWQRERLFTPSMDSYRVKRYCQGWNKAVQRSLNWED